ncbi:MAG: NUDIX hydrolase, partial [Spirochaetia bacterium]
NAGENAADALIREAREELGIDASGAAYLYSYLSEGTFESEYAECFMHESSQPINPDPGEIDEGRHFPLDEVRGMIGTGALTPMFEREWPLLLAALGES